MLKVDVDNILTPSQIKSVGQLLIEMRITLGLSQVRLDSHFSLSRGTIQRYEEKLYSQCAYKRIQHFYKVLYELLEDRQKKAKQ